MHNQTKITSPLIAGNSGSLQNEPNESNGCCSCFCGFLCQIMWLIFGGGIIMLIIWYLFALIATILLIPIPSSIALFKISASLITPSTRYTDAKTVNVGCCGAISRFFWIFPFGLLLSTLHIIFGILYSPLLCCGCYWTTYHFNALSNVFNPGNKIVINMKIHKFNFYSHSYDVVKNIHNLSNKVCIITGCNTGIGKETAKQLYKKGCIVVMACRNTEKANKARNDMIEEIKNGNPQNLIFIRLDLADLKTIDEFVDEFNQNQMINGKLDYLINNAGVMAFPKFGTTLDGIERQFGINHMGHFYLVNKLIQILKQNKTRIISVSSCGHYIFNDAKDMTDFLKLENAEKAKGPTPDIIPYNKGGFRYYGISKLCNVLFTRQLNKLYNEYGIVALCLHPGSMPGTELTRNMGISSGCVCCSFLTFPAIHEGTKPKTVSQGAATTLRCVTITDEEIFGGDNNLNNINNMMLYFDDCIARNDKMHKEFMNGENTKIDQLLWDYSCQIINSLDYLQLNEQ